MVQFPYLLFQKLVVSIVWLCMHWDGCVQDLMGLIFSDLQCLTRPFPLHVAETPDCDRDKLLLSREFLRNCMDILSVPTSDTTVEFPIKHLNIMDPLKSNNNLGRSVSRGNFTHWSNIFLQSLCDCILVLVDWICSLSLFQGLKLIWLQKTTLILVGKSLWIFGNY